MAGGDVADALDAGQGAQTVLRTPHPAIATRGARRNRAPMERMAWACLHGLAARQLSGRLPESRAQARLEYAHQRWTGASQLHLERVPG